MRKIIVLLVMGAVLGLSNADDQEYCRLACPDRNHTLCAYTADNKCEKLIRSGLSEEEKRRIVDYHNELRRKVSVGNETRGSPGPQPAAKNMNTLQWDDDIAKIAQIWADQCSFGHDSCRNTPREYIGQNVGSRGSTGRIESITIDSLVDLWYDEVRLVDSRSIYQPFSGTTNANGEDVGHYTQLVWSRTERLGCGAVRYTDASSRFNNFYLVCNYGPGGNIIGATIYEPRDNQTSSLQPSQNTRVQD